MSLKDQRTADGPLFLSGDDFGASARFTDAAGQVAPSPIQVELVVGRSVGYGELAVIKGGATLQCLVGDVGELVGGERFYLLPDGPEYRYDSVESMKTDGIFYLLDVVESRHAIPRLRY